MLETIGVKFLADGIEDQFNMVSGVNDNLLNNINLKYDGGDSPSFSVDRLAATDSEELYRSDDGFGRIFLNDPGESFKVIASTMTFGALRDGDSLSMKPYLIAEMIDYLLGITTVTDIKEVFGQVEGISALAYPNPATSSSTLSFNLKESADVSLMVYDELGRNVRLIASEHLSAGDQSIVWNLKNDSGISVNNGFYYYQLIVNGQSEASGKILVTK